jgi:hypothetical protein
MQGGAGTASALALLAAAPALAAPAPAPTKPAEILRIDYSKPFATRSRWQLLATQGPPTEDYGGNSAPGAIQLCFEKGAGGDCTLDAMPPQGPSGPGWEPHYLGVIEYAFPKGRSAPPLLHITTASLHAGDGGQLVATQIFRYNRAGDRFERVFARSVGTNNNEEVRFVTSGPLAGSIVSAEPTQNAPFGYWIEVDALTPTDGYKRVLRYRSATHYGDGNRLAVIDSEMPKTLQRLGKWKPGEPLPLPAGACPKPHLVKGELWCE